MKGLSGVLDLFWAHFTYIYLDGGFGVLIKKEPWDIRQKLVQGINFKAKNVKKITAERG